MRRYLVILLLFAEHSLAQDLALKPEDPASAVHPRKFGLPGGIGVTRGWYVWHKFDAKTGQAEVAHEGTGQKYTVRVLPWLTTYRHLAYGANPDELLPGERVNLFFNPDDKQQRAYLVHFQDEMCQMKGHNHAWRVEKVTGEIIKGREDAVIRIKFTARVMAGDKALDDKVLEFGFDPKCIHWRDGKKADGPYVKAGERVYLTWCYEDKRRVVKLISDAASLDAIQKEAKKRIAERVKKEGMTGFVEEVAKEKTRVLVFATWWQQAGELKNGATLRLQQGDADPIAVKLVSRKNLGTYGSGCSELIVDGLDAKQIETMRGWTGSNLVRVF
ncbi:MAG: hypothetical protein HY289_09230, partial [Planctomycetes bacterium]|nr:hypothetical protein [Planctomycetota bacterium]